MRRPLRRHLTPLRPARDSRLIAAIGRGGVLVLLRPLVPPRAKMMIARRDDVGGRLLSPPLFS